MDKLEPKDVAALDKVRALKPKTADVLHEFKDSVQDAPDGRKFKVNVEGRKAINKMREMHRPYWRASKVLSAEFSAKQERVLLRNPRGQLQEIAANSESVAKVQGFLPVKLWSPVRKFAACPRRWFECGHYTETAGETVCPWCTEAA